MRGLLTLLTSLVMANLVCGQTFIPITPKAQVDSLPAPITIINSNSNSPVNTNTNNNSNLQNAITSGFPGPGFYNPEGDSILGLHLMVGQQLGLRGQLAISRNPGFAWVMEGFYGGSFSKLGNSDAVATGVRAQVRRSSNNGDHSLLIAPGANLMYNLRDGKALYLNPSLDLSWVNGFDNWRGSGWEIGVNLGVGVGISGKAGDPNRNAAGEVTPLISLFGGVRF